MTVYGVMYLWINEWHYGVMIDMLEGKSCLKNINVLSPYADQ